MKPGAKLFPFWESMSQPAAVSDDDKWQKAKDAAAKSYDVSDPAYWPVVMHLYQKMGGAMKQADGGSSFPQVLRSQESGVPTPTTIRFRESTTFREASTSEDPQAPQSRFSAIILQEGMGNFGTSFYYTKEALQSAVEIFEGKKIYADHPTATEDEVRPERSVRDILGYHGGVKVSEESDGHSVLSSDVVIKKSSDCDWARELMKEAIEYSKKYPDQDFIGLSINANGQADPWDIEEYMKQDGIPAYCMAKLVAAKEAGITEIRVVSKFINAISCDLVTEAGAGGRVTKLIEGNEMKIKKTKEADQKHPAGGAPSKEAEPAHDDVAADKALIAQMLKKHAGKGGDGTTEPTDEDMGLASECMKMAKEKGLSGEEAEAHAMASMEAIKGYGAMKQKQADDKAAAEKPAVEPEKEAAPEPEKEADPVPAKDETKESKLEKENLQLRGAVALLEKKQRKVDMAEYLDKKLSESGEERKVTNIFREAIDLESVKTTKEIDAKWENFLEGYRVGRQSVGMGELVINVEKRGEPAKDGLDLTDCVG